MSARLKRPELQKALYEVGMPIRRAVLSDAYVDNALKDGSTEFGRPMQEFTTAYCSGAFHELAVHVRGAVNNGLSATEIREVLVQVCTYMGVPAGMEAFKAAEKVLLDMAAEGVAIKP
ncbi:hypothetical protein K469DRAFT_736778 [Zopfia rhizophila CBS 207.26]|uniref:Carboxymuconolactone decarboxylase-like domain-containing protein n=1 Tax=Zopfia rhizophila CBS 207.26 TaxID=1314779 RepID=A0A6A6EJP0_9PEZI|nr:hypothetical protein K469DRAFT_736778 [Zopfia rhizophila CBS 207.26]